MSTKDVETGPGPVCEEVEKAEESKSCRPIGSMIGLVFSLVGIVFSIIGTLIWLIGSLLGWCVRTTRTTATEMSAL